jgi:hypothetical protein
LLEAAPDAIVGVDVGHQILADSESELLRLAATIALTHHERWDGGAHSYQVYGVTNS